MYFSKEIQIPFPADAILQELIAGINKIKKDFIKGLYVTGSIPLKDFHPDKSDIDFLILCNELPDKDHQLQLEAVHSTIERKLKKPNLSGTYLTGDGLHVPHSHKTKTLSWNEGRMRDSSFEMAPVTLYELKTTAITLLGIPAQKLPVTVEISDVNRFLFENINTYWKKWVDERSTFSKHQLLLILFPRLTEWIILGVARQLYTLRTGKIASKTDAGYYCLEHLPNKYHPVVNKAIEIRKGKRKHILTLKTSYYVLPSMKRYHETLDCAYFIMDLFNEEYKNNGIGHSHRYMKHGL